MDERRPRHSEVRVDFGRDQIITGMKVADDGTLAFFGPQGELVTPAHIETGSAYRRSKKDPKVLARSVMDPTTIHLDPNRALQRFAFVVAADTNTQEIQGTKVSVTASVLVSDIEIKEPQWKATLVPQDAFEFHDAESPPERVGWADVVSRITSTPGISCPVALIVDSELGSLSAINARREPILGTFYLPDGVELLYASGDRGTAEFIGNAAIADCDRTASRLLESIRTSGMSGDYQQRAATPYRRFRLLRMPGTGWNR